jgi:hypothetical protein
MIVRWACVLATAALVGCSGTASRTGSDEPDDPQAALKESAVTLPSYPKDGDLREFAGPSAAHRYYLDSQAISVVGSETVRYTAVVKTAGGATNVSYEGMRCRRAEKRVYAIGRDGSSWIPVKKEDWTPIRPGYTNEYQTALYRGILCDGRTVRSRAEALRVLAAGVQSKD